MLLSRDEEVAGMGLTVDEADGLDWAVAELRRVLGKVDAYVATYRKTGMNGKTIILGRREPGRKGNPFMSLGYLEHGHLLRLSLQGDDDRAAILKALGTRSTWGRMRDDNTFALAPLASAGSDRKAFTSTFKRFAEAVQTQARELYDRRIAGDCRMPEDYRDVDAPHGVDEPAIEHPDARLVEDLQELEQVRDATTRLQLIQARVGQGTYREQMLALWGDACAVTGCKVPSLIRASHAQPWADAVPVEKLRPGEKDSRLDPDNGLPLIGTLDLLFDAGLMTFDDDGNALFSDDTIRQELVLAGVVPAVIRLQVPGGAPLRDGLKHYLAIHRRDVFEGRLSAKMRG